MEANEFQIGGAHYNGKKYQHWDLVIDTKMHYILGCATKYISRWREKNGVEDLKKSLHYIQKAEENNIYFMKTNWFGRWSSKEFKKMEYLTNFTRQLCGRDSSAIQSIGIGNYKKAIEIIQDMIEEIEFGPNSHYIRG